MAENELPDFNEIMNQSKENERNEAKKAQSQSQSQSYETSQPQQKEASLPQPYQPPQTQSYEVSQPQTYQPPQSQFYQPPQSQLYQPPQTQLYQPPEPQVYQQPLPQNQTPLYISPPVTNNMYQDGANQFQNYATNQNLLMDNHELFHDDIKAANKKRLYFQLILAVLLLLSSVFLTLSSIGTTFYIILLSIILDIFYLIIGIWMIILTKRGQTTRNVALGIISLISLIILILKFAANIYGAYKSRYDLLNVIILLIIVFYNTKCKCCD